MKKMKEMKPKIKRILVAGMATTMLFGSVFDVSAAGLRDIFDAKYYADSYADLKEAFGYDENLLYNHFITYGLQEGRNMSPVLDVAAYREAYEDLRAAFGDDWEAYVNHFLSYGAGEMRERGVLFNPVIYVDAYPDIKAAYGDDLLAIIRHYLTFGIAENRTIGTSNGYADMAAARMAEWEARQVTPNGGSVQPSDTGKTGNISAVWSKDGRIESEYDNRGNCISVTTYDAAGNKRWSTHYTFNSNDELVRSESRDPEGNCTGYDEYEYEGGKIKKTTSYYGNGKVSYSKTYEWNGNTVKISEYNENNNLLYYSECETDSRLNTIKEKQYTSGGDLIAYYEYTYDKNDNVLTKIGYNPGGTEVKNVSFTYYENGTKKTETDIKGSEKEVFEYNENGSTASNKYFVGGILKSDETYVYYAEGPLAKKCSNLYFGGASKHDEVDYDRQGRELKKSSSYKDAEGSESMDIIEYAADGSKTLSYESYDSGKRLTRKGSMTYDAQDKPVKEISYKYSDGNVESVVVRDYENGRIVKDAEYGADGVTLNKATVYTYVDTEYGYEQTIKKLNAGGSVVETEIYMCDEKGEHLGSRIPLSNGGFVKSWYGGQYENENQSWYYTAEGKLHRKKIMNEYNVVTAVYEYDDDGKEIALVYDAAADEWVRP